MTARHKLSLPGLSILFLLFWMALANVVQGQAPPQETNNTIDSGSRSEMRVDPSTLALGFQLSLGNYPGRAGSSLPSNISYSSKVWRIEFEDIFPGTIPRSRVFPRYAEHSASGWSTNFDVPTLEGLEWQPYDDTGAGICMSPSCPQPGPNEAILYVYRLLAHMPDGSTHELRRDDTPTPSHTTGNVYYAVEGSRIRYDENNQTLYLPDGSRYVYGTNSVQYIDRNGNTLTYNSGTKQWSDTLGRTIGRPPVNTGATGYVTYSIPGVAGSTVTYRLRWRYLSEVLTTANPLRYKGDRTWTNPTMQTLSPSLFSSWPVPDEYVMTEVTALFNPVVLNEVELPNGRRYTFTYNVWGEIDKVVYPTGGYERYVYGPIDGISTSLQRSAYAQANRGVVDRWVSVTGDGSDEAQNHWHYSATGTNSPYTVTLTAPDGSYTKRLLHGGENSDMRFGFDDVRNGMAYDGSSYSSSGQMLRRTLTEWTKSGPLPGGEGTATRDPRVTKTVEIILDTGGEALTKTTSFTYDADLNRISTNEYSYKAVSQTTGQTGAIGSIAAGALLRTSEATYLVNDAAIAATTRDAYRARNLVGLPTSSRVKNAAGSIVAQSSISYDEATYPLLTYGAVTGWTDPATTVRGNATTSGSWLNTTGTYVQTHAQYDQCGNVRNVWDAKGNQSQVEYSSAYSYAYPTLTRTAVPDPSGQYGSTTPLLGATIYDFNTGLVTSKADVNDQTTSHTYTDPLNRIRTVTLPDGGLTTYNYHDGPGSAYVETVTRQSSTQDIYSYQFFDPLGRPNRSFLGVGGGNYTTADTQYDSMGRVWRVSNPYLSTGSASAVNPSGAWITSAYDALGQVVSVTTPDGAQVGTSYAGSSSGTLGLTVTVTDQALKKRRSLTDALGRLIRVDEPDANDNLGEVTSALQPTSYTYDVLDNLTTVSQGVQTRYFMYDSLKRLMRARNPEQSTNATLNLSDPLTGNSQWSIGYQYDNNGNLTRKTDARGIYADYLYDALNRNTNVNYSDATPDTLRQYDLAINGKGRLNQVWQAGSTTSATYLDSFDALGRPLVQRQRYQTAGVWSGSFQTTRAYNLAGGVTSEIYPSGRTVNYAYDNAGRASSFSGNLGDGVARTYASAITYSPFGGLQQEQFGTQLPLFHKLHYNVRGQMYDVRLSTVAWATDQWNWNRGSIALYFGYPHQQSGLLNNGNVSKMQHFVPASDQLTQYNYTEQRYVYDELNRLESVSEYPGTQSGLGAMSFTQIYKYDRWGNRTIDPATTDGMPETQFVASSANNRLGVPAGYSGRMDYDAAGNLVNDTYTSYGRTDGVPTRLYDAENRLITAKDGSLQVVSSYSYNADGQRTRRTVNGVQTWQVYGMDGELLGEYASGAASFVATKEYGYRNGQLLVTVTSGDDQRLKRFVQALYYGGLQRDPTSAELSDKINQLAAAGAQSQAQLLVKAKEIARALFAQTNYETNAPLRSETQYVTDLYYAYLQRGPDAGGLGWWAPQAAGSVQNRINVLNAFEASSEFQTLVNTLYGTATSDSQRTENYVTNFYQGALGRPPTSSELATNSATLNNAAAQGQTQVISAAETMGRALFAAQVNDASLSNTQFVTNLYEGFLQRGPDAGGLSSWAGQASVGSGRQNVLNAFATSSAFRELAGTLYREASWLVADHLGTPRMIVNKSGTLAGIKRHDYLPFGEELFAGTSGRTATPQGYSADTIRQKFTRYERDNETGLDYARSRYYSSSQGRFISSDILFADQKEQNPQNWNLYSYCRNDPINYTDPEGKSTHTDKDGNVVAVYDDGDLGVYRHDDLRKWNGKKTLPTTGKGVLFAGETEHWDEFRAHDNKTGAILPDVAKGARIIFGGASFDQDIDRLNSQARTEDLRQVANGSTLNQKFDIKNNKAIAPYGPNTGKLLNGYFVTARSAGNYLAGYNGATSTYFQQYISGETYMKIAGAVQQGKWSKTTAAKIVTYGKAYGPAPWYGEIEYTGRRVQQGFNYGVTQRPK